MKTLLACLTSAEHADDILSAAVPLARRAESHLIGMHTIEALAVYPSVVVHLPETVYTGFTESQRKRSNAIRRKFEDRMALETLAHEWREVRAESMSASDSMVEAARTADLVIMAQADQTTDLADQYHAQEHVIRRSGRPVLHVPKGYRGEILGRSIVIGWSPTREAARAAHDVLPLLQPGANVAIVTVTQEDDQRYEGATDLARAFDRHGMEAEVVRRTAHRPDIEVVLQQEAMQRDADMIVTGAFGHSRLYDFVIGAVTLDLMRASTIPVLFSR